MREIFSLLVMALCSCGQTSNSTKMTKDGVTGDSLIKTGIFKPNKKTEKGTNDSTIYAWEKHEDSLRNEILKGKENKILRKSFLREMYVRNVVRVSRDMLFVTIPFNLHGPDCGAPDCYSTDISFNFKLGNTLKFPQNVQFEEHEHGCVEREEKRTGSFQLIEQTDKHVIYHSDKPKRTLVLFSSNKENGTTAFFFREVGKNRISGKNVYSIVEDYDEEDKNSIYPFTSWVLTTNEYGNFLYK